MPAWIPLVKVVLPYLGPIFSAALPTLTKKISAKTDPLVNQQIKELQEAVKANDERITALVKAFEEAVVAHDREIRRSRLIAIVAVAVAFLLLALVVATPLK